MDFIFCLAITRLKTRLLTGALLLGLSPGLFADEPLHVTLPGSGMPNQ